MTIIMSNVNRLKKIILEDSLSDKKLIGEYLAKLQATAWLSHALCAPGHTLLRDEESARDNHVLACNFANYLPI